MKLMLEYFRLYVWRGYYVGSKVILCPNCISVIYG